MKKLIIIALALIVSVAAHAQRPPRPVHPVKQTVKTDTVYTIKLNQSDAKVLFVGLDGFNQLVRRSPDLSALQADEAAKKVDAIGKTIFEQMKAQLPDRRDSTKTAAPKK